MALSYEDDREMRGERGSEREERENQRWPSPFGNDRKMTGERRNRREQGGSESERLGGERCKSDAKVRARVNNKVAPKASSSKESMTRASS